MFVTNTDIVIASEQEVDDRAGDDHGGDAEPGRQQRGQHRAEDRQQHDQDRREAGGLGLLEVLLLELLHARPERLLADDVGLDAVRRPRRPSAPRAGPWRPGGCRRRLPSTTSGMTITTSCCAAACLAASAASGASSTCSIGSPRRRRRGRRRRPRSPPLAWSTMPSVSPLLWPWKRSICLSTSAEPEPGDLEAAAGQVLGLLARERHRDDDQQQPQRSRRACGASARSAESRFIADCIRAHSHVYGGQSASITAPDTGALAVVECRDVPRDERGGGGGAADEAEERPEVLRWR